jgi:hypothetical protein
MVMQLAARKKQASDDVQEDGSVNASKKPSQQPEVWKSEELNLLAIGIGVGDVTGDGRKNLVLIDPSTVYLYRFSPEGLALIAQYSVGSLECKSVDVAKIRKQGPCRIYVTAQNRALVSSLVLEYRNGQLIPVVQNFPYYLRVILYPTKGPILLGQKKGLNKAYEGPMFRIEDKGDDLAAADRFGVPLKIPIFGFAIGDFAGNRKPLIAVYDRDDHIRIYTPSGQRLFVSDDYYGGSDVLLRQTGPEEKRVRGVSAEDTSAEYCRPRIMAVDLNHDGVYEILATSHKSKTMRVLGRTKMLEEGRVMALAWNGDVLEPKWSTPTIQGMVTDFTVDSLPGLSGNRLVVVERKRTDWLSFIRSRSQVRAYDLQYLMGRAPEPAKKD